MKHIRWNRSISYDLLFKFKGELSRFKNKKNIIGIICTNNKISQNTLNELKRFSRLAICTTEYLTKCIKECYEKY